MGTTTILPAGAAAGAAILAIVAFAGGRDPGRRSHAPPDGPGPQPPRRVPRSTKSMISGTPSRP